MTFQPVKLYFNDEIRRFSIEGPITYDIFVRKVNQLYPDLTTPVKLAWKDEEDDFITLGNDEELQEALKQKKGDLFHVYLLGTENRNNSSSGRRRKRTAAANANESKSDTDNDDDIEEIVVHKRVVCDGCDGPVIGMRYKCLICKGFDLCESCAKKGVHDQHPMIRIATPKDKSWRQAYRTCRGKWAPPEPPFFGGCMGFPPFPPPPPRFGGEGATMNPPHPPPPPPFGGEGAPSHPPHPRPPPPPFPFNFHGGIPHHHHHFKHWRKGGRHHGRGHWWYPAADPAAKSDSSSAEEQETKDEEPRTPLLRNIGEMVTSTLHMFGIDADIEVVEPGGKKRKGPEKMDVTTEQKESAKTNTTATASACTEPVGSSTAAKPSAPLPPPKVQQALDNMLAMGFTNQGGWLTDLLIQKDGNISAVLEALQPSKIDVVNIP